MSAVQPANGMYSLAEDPPNTGGVTVECKDGELAFPMPPFGNIVLSWDEDNDWYELGDIRIQFNDTDSDGDPDDYYATYDGGQTGTTGTVTAQ